MRLFTSVLASVSMSFAASGASALTFTVISASSSSGNPLSALIGGDEVTINVRMSNPAGVQIWGVGAGAQSWDQSIAQFVSGEMSEDLFFCETPACTVGLPNALPLPIDEATGNFLAGPADVQNVPGVGNYIPIVQAITARGRAGDGQRDPGLDGVINGGDAQFRLVFRMTGLQGTTAITIGTNGIPILGNVVVLSGGMIEQAVNATVVLSIIPEPGTGILIGLGLAALGARRGERR